MSPAGIVEVVAVERLAPFIEDSNKASAFNVVQHVILKHEADPASGEHRRRDEVDIVLTCLIRPNRLRYISAIATLPGVGLDERARPRNWRAT